MKRSACRLLAAACFAFVSNCAVFISQRPAPPSPPEQPVGDVNIEFINWQLPAQVAQAKLIESVFRTAGFFDRVEVQPGGTGWSIEIVNLEYPGEITLGEKFEQRPLQESFGFINRLVAGRTFLLFPIYHPVDRFVRFSVYRRGIHVRDYDYQSRAHIFVGWLTLLAAPWSESRELQLEMVTIARTFMAEATRDGLFRREGESR